MAAPPLNREVYKTCKNNGTKADIHNGTNADIHNGTKANIHAKTSEKRTFILTGVAVGVGGGGAENSTGTPDACPRLCMITIISAICFCAPSNAAFCASSCAVSAAVCSWLCLFVSCSSAYNISLQYISNLLVILVCKNEHTISITWSASTCCSAGVGRGRMAWLELVLRARIASRFRTVEESMAPSAIHSRPCFLPPPSLMIASASMGSVRTL